MARTILDAWIPVEHDSSVIQRVNAVSAVESVSRTIPMNSDTKSVPRSGGITVGVVPKGSAYDEDGGENDEVTLRARKFGSVARIAEEDIDDSLANVIEAKQIDWASSYARAVDNAALGVTGEMNGTTVPFESVYHTLSQADSSLGYQANANIVSTSGDLTYGALSDVLSVYEGEAFYAEDRTVVIAHPGFKGLMRGLVDDNGRPIFVDGGAAGSTLFGLPVRWSAGARTSPTVTDAPNGNPLMVVANADFLLLGIRSGPEAVVIDGRGGASALTDETLLKMRSRRGFALGHPAAAAALEITGAEG